MADPATFTLSNREPSRPKSGELEHSFSSAYSHVGGDSRISHSTDEVPINVNSFRGAGVVVKVAKQPGMESTNLLAEDDESAEVDKAKEKGKTNFWNRLTR